MDIVGRLKQIKKIDDKVNLLSVVLNGGEEPRFTIKVFYADILLTVATVNSRTIGYSINTPGNKVFKVYTGPKDIDNLSCHLIADCVKINAQALYKPAIDQLKINMKECKENV